jgi:pantoate--beta-alanine ligase
VRTVATISAVRSAVRTARIGGASVGFVPTMGALHDGHISLVRAARAECDLVVMSIFVNPTQFNDAGDLAAYPRDAARDAALAAEAGVDVLFVPAADEMYPAGFATTVSVAGLTDVLEGAHRGAAHFHGVTTVVTKLLNIVAPDAAYFGQKDAQQALVVRRLVRDLDIPVRIEVCPTVREADGLALSSRNRHLSEGDRERARSLGRALEAARTAVAGGASDPAEVLGAARAPLADAGIEPEYVALVDPDTLTPVETLGESGGVLVAVAAQVGPVRLIDNTLIRLEAARGGRSNRTTGSESAEPIGASTTNIASAAAIGART